MFIRIDSSIPPFYLKVYKKFPSLFARFLDIKMEIKKKHTHTHTKNELQMASHVTL